MFNTMPDIELVNLVSRGNGSIAESTRRMTLQRLPSEIQIMIFYYLSYSDLYGLNRINRYYRSLFTYNFIRGCFTPLQWDAALLEVCGECQRPKPVGKHLVALSVQAFQKPLGAYCVSCSLQTRLLTPGVKVFFANDRHAHTKACRWCAWPTWTSQVFHNECAYKYLEVIELTRWLMLIRTALSWNACCLAWSNFHTEAAVLGPTVVSTTFAQFE
jgi:hypothetical protein